MNKANERPTSERSGRPTSHGGPPCIKKSLRPEMLKKTEMGKVIEIVKGVPSLSERRMTSEMSEEHLFDFSRLPANRQVFAAKEDLFLDRMPSNG